MRLYQNLKNFPQYLTLINLTMNNSFYKILKLELKLNFINWLILLGIFAIIMVWQMTYKDSSIIGGSIIPLMILFSSLITLHSYSESTSRQSMEMYHLLPTITKSKLQRRYLSLSSFLTFSVSNFKKLNKWCVRYEVFGIKSIKI